MSGQGGGGGGGSENLLIGAIFAIFGVSIFLLFAGGLSTLIYSGTTPSASLGAMPGVLIGILTNPGNPAAAYPDADQAIIAPALLFWFVFVALLAALGGIAYVIWNFFKNGAGFGGGSKGGLGAKATQWARKGDLKSLIVRDTTPGRLTLGTVGGAMIATELRHSVIVLGPTQSGKTTGLAVPAILEWEGPVIATSVKNDLAENTLAWRERKGDVWVYDPTAATGLPMATWSPLDGAREWAGAKKIAAWLTNASKSNAKGLSDGDFWYSAAGKLLAPHLFAAAANGYTMADVVRWIDTQEEYEVRALLAAIPGSDGEDAMRAADASWQREDRARSSIYTTAEVVIEAYSDPTVLQSARSSEIQARRFLDGGQHTLYVCAPGHEQDRLRPVFSTLLRQIIRAAYDAAPLRPQKRLDPTLLIVLDEAANIAPLEDLPDIASTCSGLGIQLITVWQDLSQINNRYGDRAQTVVNNHRAKIVLSGISDTSTLDLVSRLIGSEEVKSVSTSIAADGSKSTSHSTADKNLAPSDILRRIKMNEGVLIYGALLPARLQLRPWYKDKRLSAMVNNDKAAVKATMPQPKGAVASGKGGGKGGGKGSRPRPGAPRGAQPQVPKGQPDGFDDWDDEDFGDFDPNRRRPQPSRR